MQRRYRLIARALVTAAAFPLIAGCSAGAGDGANASSETADGPFSAQQPGGPDSAANGCIDSTSKNLTTQDFIDLGLLGEGYRELIDPVLSAMTPGSYAKYVSAICADIPSGSRQEFSPRGALAKHAIEGCIGLNGAMTVDDVIQRFVPAVQGDAELIKWVVTDIHAKADYFCPTRFKK